MVALKEFGLSAQGKAEPPVLVQPAHTQVACLCQDGRMLVFGLAMVAMMIWRPRGIVTTRTPSVVLRKGTTISGEFVKEGQG